MIAAKKPNAIWNMLNAMGNIQIHILHVTFHGSKKVMCPHCTPHCNSCPDWEQTQICQVLVMLGNLFCETLNGIRENNNTACVEENNNVHPYTIRLSNRSTPSADHHHIARYTASKSFATVNISTSLSSLGMVGVPPCQRHPQVPSLAQTSTPKYDVFSKFETTGDHWYFVSHCILTRFWGAGMVAVALPPTGSSTSVGLGLLFTL